MVDYYDEADTKHETFLCRGAQAIAEAVGRSRREVPYLVSHKGLPAWKRNAKGPWFALRPDLEKWLKKERDRYLVRLN
jgi:hypothetical protein